MTTAYALQPALHRPFFGRFHHRALRLVACCLAGALFLVLAVAALTIPTAPGDASGPRVPSAGSPTATTLPGPGTP